MTIEKGPKEIQLIKLSASSCKTYEQCPRKYFYTYIEKLPKKHFDHFDLGTICHEALEAFHNYYIDKGGKKGLSKIMGDCFAQARTSFPDMPDVLITEAKKMLTDYLKMIKENGMPIVKSCEKSFEVQLSDTVMIRGFVDRIDITKDGKFKIIDYKTTKNAQYLDPFQLLVYGVWLRKEYPDIKEFTGSYVLLRHGSKFKEYTFNLLDIEAAEKKLLEYAVNINTENTWVPIPSKLCNFCDFKGICPAQKSW